MSAGYPALSTPFRLSHHDAGVGSAGIGWAGVPFGLQFLLEGIDINVTGPGVGTTVLFQAQFTPIGGGITRFWSHVDTGNFETQVYASWRGAIPIYEADSIDLSSSVSTGTAFFGFVAWGQVTPLSAPLLAPVRD